MPRLPTIRVIGSHAMSTSSLPWVPRSRLFCVAVMTSPSIVALAGARGVWARGRWVLSPGPGGAGGEFRAGPPPLGLAVERVRRDLAQPAHRGPVEADRVRGQLAAGRLVHERHELVGEARHRAA